MNNLLKLLALIICATSLSFSQLIDNKKKVAVIDLDNKSSFQLPELGANVADMLTTELVNRNHYKMIERSLVNAIFKEWSISLALNGNDEVKVYPVDAFIFGTITEFGVKTTETSVGIGEYRVGGKYLKGTVRIVIDARVIDARTGEIFFATTAKGELYSTNISAIYQEYSASTGIEEFDQTQIGKATRKAIDEIVINIINHY